MPKILIAEDEAHILRVMSLWLTRHGHVVLEAPNGAVALELLDGTEVDMIISDMNMPVMNGLELAKAVRQERGLDVPYLMLTARCDQETINAQIKPYRIHLLPKPFVPSRLVAQIDQLLSASVT